MLRVTSNATNYLICRPLVNGYFGNSNSGSGMVRYNAGKLEAYDGYNWQDISPHLDLEITKETLAILEWANKKMTEDKKIEDLLDKHPGLREAHDRYEIMRALVLKENSNEMV